jgi:MerR family transcriptional regulator, light-induced transcriptional regulator
MQYTRPIDRWAKAPVLLRSAAVARLAAMPVATLRIWEQRYGLASSEPSPAKHRLYTAQDVQRVVLMRQLTQKGHAIGSLAHLDWAQLQEICGAGRADATNNSENASASEPLRIAVVGYALSLRLQRPAVAQQLMGRAQVVCMWESMEQALQESRTQSIDLLLWHAPELQPSMMDQVAGQVRRVKQTLQTSQVAIIYRFAPSKLQQVLSDTQVLAVREPADDDALIAWLIATRNAIANPASTHTRPANSPFEIQQIHAPRGYDDATLTALAGLSPSLACECPNHLAQLLMQLASFEQYSAGCVNQSPEDTELHNYLYRTAGTARAMLETALERVARHEGLVLTASPADRTP